MTVSKNKLLLQYPVPGVNKMAYLQTVQLAAVDKTLIFIISEQGILNF
jgi:hypothetical protein